MCDRATGDDDRKAVPSRDQRSVPVCATGRTGLRFLGDWHGGRATAGENEGGKDDEDGWPRAHAPRIDAAANRSDAIRRLGRVILAHLDLDAFFAAVEELEDPELRERPLIVGGDPHGRGVVATANYHARRFGIQ